MLGWPVTLTVIRWQCVTMCYDVLQYVAMVKYIGTFYEEWPDLLNTFVLMFTAVLMLFIDVVNLLSQNLSSNLFILSTIDYLRFGGSQSSILRASYCLILDNLLYLTCSNN